TVEGANILIRSLMLFGQGLIRYHPYLMQELTACQQGDSKRFDALLFAHIGYISSNKVRSFWLGLTRGYGSRAPVRDDTRRYYQHINRLSANLAWITDVLLVLMKSRLKQKERLSARLGDIWSQLYLSAATLKRFEQEGSQHDDLPLVHWSIQDSLWQAQQALDDLLRNLPNRFLASLLRFTLFPTGKPLSPPSDKLEKRLARSLLAPSPTRDRLARGLFMQPTSNNPVGQLQEALADIIAAEAVHQKLCLTCGKNLPFLWLDQLAQQYATLLTADEMALLQRAEQSRLRSINVDEFPFTALKSVLGQEA
ncbi:MAG: acyl-CoA dehydrogenase domain-containing protein, partial [Enterobacteriaceae bacterium]